MNGKFGNDLVCFGPFRVILLCASCPLALWYEVGHYFIHYQICNSLTYAWWLIDWLIVLHCTIEWLLKCWSVAQEEAVCVDPAVQPAWLQYVDEWCQQLYSWCSGITVSCCRCCWVAEEKCPHHDGRRSQIILLFQHSIRGYIHLVGVA